MTGDVHWSSVEPICYHKGIALSYEEDRLFTVGNPYGCQLIDVNTLQELDFPIRRTAFSPVLAPTFSPDGRWFFAKTHHRNGLRGSLQWNCWSYPEFKLITPLDWSDFRPPSFSPDSKLVAYFNDKSIDVYDIYSPFHLWKQFPVLKKEGWRLAFSADAQLLALALGKRLTVWHLDTGDTVATLTQAERHFLDVAFTPNGRYMGTVSNEGTVKMWSTDTWELAREYHWQIGGLKCLAFSHDGLLAAAGSDKKKIVVWDLED